MSTPQRTNSDGDLCPDWCNVNHDQVPAHIGYDGSARDERLRVPHPLLHSRLHKAPGYKTKLIVMADGWASTMDSRHARELADLIDAVAKAGKREAQLFANEIRADAELLAEEER